ncbi:MAG: endo-1,4-beta-xylanase [Phycisphaerae bacterium]|nr:endo-1,4-beta-xylanase [Phycisphaerae bacterium]
MRKHSLSILLFPILCLPMRLQGAPGKTLSAKAILDGAEARIEKHRKGDAVVRVVDASGKPVSGATVRVEQTRHAFLFGSNIFMWGRCRTPEQNQAYQRRFAEVLNYATLPYYWGAYEPQQGKPSHTSREQVARWCQANGIATKGHPLAWNNHDPRWLPADPDKVMPLQLERIADCVRRFRGLIDRWDVVNEATHFDRENFKMQAPKLTRTWSVVGQVEFTKRCFAAARAANPDAVLLINDYRRDPAYAELITKLVDTSGKRIYDAIGIQSHMHGKVWPTELVWEACERFARFGVPLHFTETTIVSGRDPGQRGKPWVTTPEGERMQARETARFYTVLFSHPAIEAITWWDLSDQGAWKQAPAGWLRADMSPKPVFEEMKKLIKDKWWTRLDGKTDAKGEMRFRGFKGLYTVEVTTADGKKTTETLELGAKGEVVVRSAGK